MLHPLQTLHGRGYHFVVPVEEASASLPGGAVASHPAASTLEHLTPWGAKGVYNSSSSCIIPSRKGGGHRMGVSRAAEVRQLNELELMGPPIEEALELMRKLSRLSPHCKP